jgi:hypothetical protein
MAWSIVNPLIRKSMRGLRSGRDLVELNKNSIESKFADVLSLNKFDIHRPLIAFYKAYSKQLLL